MRTGFELSIDEVLLKEVKRYPLPAGVTWSHVFQVLVLGALADKRKWSRDRLLQEVQKHPHGKEVRRWLLERYEDFKDD